MVPPEVVDHVHTSLLLVCQEGAHRLPPEGTGIVQPMVIALCGDGSQKVCLLEKVTQRIPALCLFAQDPEVEALVLMYDGYVTVVDAASSIGMTRSNVDDYRKHAMFPRQDAIVIMTFRRSEPFRFTVDTYRYIRGETEAVITTPPEHAEITLESSPDNDYWVVFDPLTPPVTGAYLQKLPPES